MAGPVGAPPPDPGLRRKLVYLTLFRIASVTVLLGGTAAVSWRAGEEWERVTAPLYGLVIATYVASLLSAWWLRQGRALRPLAYGQIALDVATSAVVVALTGRAESVFVFMFLLAIVNGGILLYRQGAVAALVLGLLGYTGVVAAGLRSWRGAPLPLLFVHAGAFAATAALAGYLAELLRRTGEQLAERETDLAVITALHESIVTSIPSGLLTLDALGRITFLNRAGEAMAGVQLHDLVGRPAADRFPAFLTETARGEAELPRPGAPPLRVGFSTFPLAGDQGRSLGRAVIFQDLTALRQMEERVARSERLADLGRLAAGLAHELRNPLASMMGSVELLEDSPALGPQDRRLLEIVQREGARLADLVTGFLAYARPAPPRREPVDLGALAAQTIDALELDPAANGVRLGRELEPAPAVGDPHQLRQVLWNLLVNAAQAARAVAGGSGQVRVRTAPAPGGGATLVVEDDGPGIAAEDRDRLFTPFFTTKPDGTGLGLATVHRVVEAHGGAVQVESAPGAGARFTVRLPPPAPEAG
jgi:two-component system sensor histidine kinase PilS (NtrC family)